MKKKWLIVLSALALCLCAAFGVTACDTGGSGAPTHDCTTDEHVYGEWTILSEATCATDGQKIQVCVHCAYLQTETIPETGHYYGEWITTLEPTCATEGRKEKNCTACGNVQTETIPATGEHIQLEEWKYNSTEHYFYCLSCKKKVLEGHTFEEDVCTVCAADFSTGGLKYTLSSDETHYILSGIGSAKDSDIVVAKTYDGLPVTEIAEDAFLSCNRITSIVMENNITSIGQRAFRGCENLTSVTLGEGISVIEFHTFDGCESLTQIYLPVSLKTIKAGAFSACNHLTQIHYNGSISQWCTIEFATNPISTPLFEEERGLYINGELVTDAVIDEVEFISEKAFYFYTKLKSVTIGGKVKTIGTQAFYECGNLSSLTIRSNTVQEIGVEAFYKCVNLTKLSIPKGVQTIGESAFEWCYGLQNLVIDSVTTIGASAFAGSEALTSVSFGNSLAKIGEYAFLGCYGISQITLPSSLIYIGAEAFFIGGLQSVIFENSSGWYIQAVSSFLASAEDLSDAQKAATLLKTSILYEGYAEYEWARETLVFTLNSDGKSYTVINDGEVTISQIRIPAKYNDLPVTRIGRQAFSGCSDLMNIIIPNSVTSIDESAFHGCSGLTSITIPNGVTSIAKNSFYGCSGLTSIVIPNSVTTIGVGAFVGCSGLTSITIPQSVKYIDESAFHGCSGLTSITIPNGVTSIAKNSFYGCSGLTSIAIPNSVTTIREGAFGGCSNIIQTENGVGYVDKWIINCDSSATAVNLREDTVGIGGNAFYSCRGLTSVTIPQSVKYIGERAFDSCSGLTNILIPDNVTSIGVSAFEGCSGMTSIDVGSKNQNYIIQDGILYNKGKTEIVHVPYNFQGDIVIPSGVTKISSSVLAYRRGVTSIIIPDSVTSIASSAFEGCSGLTSITLPFVGSSKDATSASSSNLFGYIFGGRSYEGGKEITQYYGSSYDATYVIPASLTSVTITGGRITEGAFSGCSGLVEMTLPFVGSSKDATNASESSLFGYIFGTKRYNGGDSTFQHYSSDSTSYLCYYIPSSLKSVTIAGGNLLYGAFYGCDGLTSVTIGNNVTSIGEKAFYMCDGLTSVTIGNNVTSIGEKAFYMCDGLTSITIGSNVTSIGNDAFYGCDRLTEIYFNATAMNDLLQDSLVFGKAGRKAVLTVTIGANVTKIPASLFSNANIESVVFEAESTCKTIGEYAFYGCQSLVSVMIGENITNIGNRAFGVCDKLIEVYNLSEITITAGSINNGYVGYRAKNIYTSLDEDSKLSITDEGYIVYADDSAQEYYLMGYAGEETQLILPETVNGNNYSIYQYAFYDFVGLTSIVIPNGVTSIGVSAFSWCTNLTNIVIPNSVTSIGSSVFSWCDKMENVFYMGTESEWGNISCNSDATNATRYYYSETQPTEEGNYWHYDTDGVTPVVW